MAQQNSFPKSHFSLLVIKQRGDSRKKLRWVDIIGSFHDKVCLRMMQSIKICCITLKVLWSKIKKNVNTWKELQYANEQGYFKK